MNAATHQFQTLCLMFLTLVSQTDRVRCLKEMQEILRQGEVE
jgi:hypothetical protein